MPFGVFIHRDDSPYDDHPATRYQFPKSYLSRARQFEGGWVLYYEPVKVRGSRGYYAVARVAHIAPDPTKAAAYVAHIEPGTYLEFPQPVAFRHDGGIMETGLLNPAGTLSGRAQAAVRPISEADFTAILDKGLGENFVDVTPQANLDGVHEGQVPFLAETSRLRAISKTNRLVRDRLFRQTVLRAYEKRCAFTGLRFINGGGRAEVEAAHIRPVKDDGPDAIGNGIALSRTVHWMFDRGLLSLSDNYDIRLSRHINDIEGVNQLLHPTRMARVPADPRLRPRPAYLAWHRDNVFKT